MQCFFLAYRLKIFSLGFSKAKFFSLELTILAYGNSRLKKIAYRRSAGKNFTRPKAGRECFLRLNFEENRTKASLQLQKFRACGGLSSKVVFFLVLKYMDLWVKIAAKRRNFFRGKNRREAAIFFSLAEK